VQDVLQDLNFFMVQTTRLFQQKIDGPMYIGDEPLITPQQAIVLGESLLSGGGLRDSQFEAVRKRLQRLVEVFASQPEPQPAGV